MSPGDRNQSPLLTGVGISAAAVALVGTQLLGWEWGDGRLVPTLIGVAAAAIAVTVVIQRRG